MLQSMNDIHTKQETILASIIERSRVLRISDAPFADNLQTIQQELRKRRKDLLGSGARLVDILWNNYELDMEYVAVLTDYLSNQTVEHWERPCDMPRTFCRNFYSICLVAIATPHLKNACLDDLILLANCLVHDGKTVFAEAVHELLPEAYRARLVRFTDSISGGFCDASFEDAVLGAISTLLGALTAQPPNFARRPTNEN